MLTIWSTRDITPLSRVCASQRTSGTISVPRHCTNIPSYTSSPTESDLGWPTLTSKAVTVTPLEEWCAGHKLLTIGSKALIIHKHLTIKLTCNNSKPMAFFLCTRRCTMSYDATLIFHRLLYACILQTHYFIILLITIIFIKMEFTVTLKWAFHESCKNACFVYINSHAMRKNNNNKYPCEFLLT
jgi:hypothetical protein